MNIISSNTGINWNCLSEDIFIWLDTKDEVVANRLYGCFKNICTGLMRKQVTWYPKDLEEEIIQDVCCNAFEKILPKLDKNYRSNSTVIYMFVQGGMKYCLRDRSRHYNEVKQREEKAVHSYRTKLKSTVQIDFENKVQDEEYTQRILDETLESMKMELADDPRSILILDCIKNNNLYYLLIDVKCFYQDFNINDNFTFKHKLCNLFRSEVKKVLREKEKEVTND